MIILIVVGFWFECYELFFDFNGVVFGVGYIDVYVKFFVYWVMVIVVLLLVVVCVFFVWKNNIIWLIYGIVIYIVLLGLFNVLYLWF